jgi:protein-export membrane protein SecD
MKFWAVVAVTLLSLFLLLPSIVPEDSGLRKYLPSRQLNLGLDLRGGVHVVLGVDLQKALEAEMNRLIVELDMKLPEEDIRVRSVEPVVGERAARVALSDPQQRVAIQDFLRKNFFQVLVVEGFESDGAMLLKMDPVHEQQISVRSLEQAREVIRSRIDQFGVAEPIIQLEGEDRILVQLPGTKDPEAAIRLIGSTALLEFRIVEEGLSTEQLMTLVDKHREAAGFQNNFSRAQLEKLQKLVQPELPKGTMLSFQKERDPKEKDANRVNLIPYLVQDKAPLTGQSLDNAMKQFDPTTGAPEVGLRLSVSGAEALEKISTDYLGRQMAILLDGAVISAPVLRSRIPAISRAAVIQLGAGNIQEKQKEADFLALVLRSGALPAPVEVLENRTVGASLGEDSIQKGEFSGLVAMILIIVFMILYYRAGGIVASIAVLINVCLLLAIMSLFQATLTLPGIAGIVLTVGMAVDANVIILERIREEIRSKTKKARAALESGYDNANSAIVDANLTTVIAGVVLYNFGSGPIKGFAVTLLIGIFTSYITGVVFTRWIYEYIFSKREIRELSI